MNNLALTHLNVIGPLPGQCLHFLHARVCKLLRVCSGVCNVGVNVSVRLDTFPHLSFESVCSSVHDDDDDVFWDVVALQEPSTTVTLYNLANLRLWGSSQMSLLTLCRAIYVLIALKFEVQYAHPITLEK